MLYWIARNNQQSGPFSLADVQSMRASGNLAAGDLAWTEGMASWAPALEVIPLPAQIPPAQPMPYAPGPVPPDMHWALVLLLSIVTFYIFGWVWMFRQANFVKRIDPRNSSRALLLVVLALALVYGVIVGVAVAVQSDTAMGAAAGAGLLVELALAIVNLIAFFKMRSSLLDYYNTVEPIGLRLSPVMTFFFNFLYFQYHFSRIARWKRGGVLAPQ